MPPIKMIVIGAGSRGRGYGRYALAYPDQAVVVGVAEPRDHYREEMAQALERHRCAGLVVAFLTFLGTYEAA